MPSFSQGFALVIGIANYHPAVGVLPPTTRNDAQCLADTLTAPDFCAYPTQQARLLLDQHATAQGIRTGFAWLAREVPPGGTVLLAFFGHGQQRGEGSAQQNYLLASDALIEPPGFGWLSEEELEESLGKIRARHLVLLLSCCHEVPPGELSAREPLRHLGYKAGLGDAFLTRLAQEGNRTVLSACQEGERSQIDTTGQYSIFGSRLCEALKGAGSPGGARTVGFLDLVHHVIRHVPIDARGQRTLFRGELRENFEVGLLPSQGPGQAPTSRASTPCIPQPHKINIGENIFDSGGGNMGPITITARRR